MPDRKKKCSAAIVIPFEDEPQESASFECRLLEGHIGAHQEKGIGLNDNEDGPGEKLEYLITWIVAE